LGGDARLTVFGETPVFEHIVPKVRLPLHGLPLDLGFPPIFVIRVGRGAGVVVHPWHRLECSGTLDLVKLVGVEREP
jgi:hypothetical protein